MKVGTHSNGHRRRGLVAVVSAVMAAPLLIAAGPASAAAPSGTETAAAPAAVRYQAIPLFGGPLPDSSAMDVSNAGVAVGYVYLGQGETRGGSWSRNGARFTGLPGVVPRFDYWNTVNGINDAGVRVGNATTSFDDFSRPVVYRDGATSVIEDVAGAANAVNRSGVIVGTVNDENFISSGRVWSNGTSTPIGTLGGTATTPYSTASEANDINDRGQVVGLALDTDQSTHGFLRYPNGAMRDLGLLAPSWQNSYSDATAVNEKSQVVGRSAVHYRAGNRNSLQATLWSPGTGLTNLGTLGPAGDYRYESEAHDINESGTVVGYARVTPGQLWGHAVVWPGGRAVDLNAVTTGLPAGIVLETANAINDNGVIVATSCNLPGGGFFCEPGATAPPTSFLLVPVT